MEVHLHGRHRIVTCQHEYHVVTKTNDWRFGNHRKIYEKKNNCPFLSADAMIL